MGITELSIRKPLLISTVFVGLCMFGIISYLGLNYNLLPSFAAGTLNIQTIYAGASPEDIQTEITKPIEEAITSVEGIDIVTSASMQNVSSITINLKPDVDDKKTQQDIERKINQIKADLPADANAPVVNRFSSDDFPILNFSVTAKISDKELYDLIDNDVKPKLSNIMGVGKMNIIGGQEKQVQVSLDNAKLESYKISPKQVYQIISASTTSYPAGDIVNEKANMSITMYSNMTSLEDINNLVIKDDGFGSRVLVKDVATIVDAQAKIKTLNRNNGKAGIGIQLYKTNDANAVKVSDEVKEKLIELKKEYASKGFDYEIATDQSVYTLASADAVMEDLVMAILIVGFVMLMFLHSLRSAMFVLVAIPSAMIPSFIVMSAMDFSLNLMTLMALSLVVGILVDDSIVVLENIFTHLEMGKPKVQAALDGRSSIGFTALAITMVDIVVFLPMAFTGGLIGNILKEFAIVVVVSTLMSLFVSFTLTPLLASRFIELTHMSEDTLWGRININFENFLTAIRDFYTNILRWVLFHKRYLFLLIIALLVGAIYLVPAGFIGASFTGTSDRGEISIQLETSPDMSLYQTNLITKQAEAIILKYPEVANAYTMVGSQSGGVGGLSNNNLAEISVSLIDKNERSINTDDFGVMARNEIEKIPGVQVTSIPQGITGSTNSPIQIVVKSNDVSQLHEVAQKVKDIVVKIPGTDYVHYSTKGVRKQIKVTPDRSKIAQYGLSLHEVSQSLQLAFSGNSKTNFTASEDDIYEINTVMSGTEKQNINDIKNLTLSNNKGDLIHLSQVAKVEESITQTILQRTNRLNSVTITSSAVGRPSGTIVKEIQEKLKTANLPKSITIDYLGDAKNQSDAFSSLGMALLLALILVYMVMVSLYESLVYPFVILFSIPVSLIGALLAIALTMNQLTIFTIIGIIMLLGLVTKNGILIVDFANEQKAQGKGVIDALIEAGKERIRPIIMTTFAMILGMIPLAVSTSPGSEFKNGMAWVLIGGLTSSFLLTLFIVPSVYLVVDKIMNRKKKEIVVLQSDLK
ncbi:MULTISPECIES: efflux RND transporter permease subunit [unclassified Chryseobacterium]|uniref:efflux RND transporter permease subunit n=1 Tax=unclassified Chryseobacterium TaxID=2593645 RepID=UPI000D384B59|nr:MULTISPECIES: efflux RND transporter permease subunit [unclassified Chryseobacterium]PTT76959.1 acriflavin resistance protein [Chryseobacterium sp. HMWF001]PVV59927.1 AcrB/AcrD/AcrF family protein [Chryseobacterium sp. HMWF035]